MDMFLQKKRETKRENLKRNGNITLLHKQKISVFFGGFVAYK